MNWMVFICSWGALLFEFLIWRQVLYQNIADLQLIIKGMVVQAKFADSHIIDKNAMEKEEDEQKASIQGSENKSFEKNEVDQKQNQDNEEKTDGENLANPINENDVTSQSQEL